MDSDHVNTYLLEELGIPLLDIYRFLWKIPRHRTPDGCCIWPHQKSNRYGQIVMGGRKGRPMYAHRISYLLFKGPIPAGHGVLHECPGGGNPFCISPAHLRVGTQKENAEDCRESGRMNLSGLEGYRIGERNGSAKVSEADVREIRRLRSEGWLLRELAAKFPLNMTKISAICNYSTWKHVL